jgi:uncharacterized repeat protein (TIGR01451 family)
MLTMMNFKQHVQKVLSIVAIAFVALAGMPFTGMNAAHGASQPTVVTNNGVYVSANTLTLYGILNPNDAVTTAWFEYGLTQSFGLETSHQTYSQGTNSVEMSGQTGNLLYNTNYYYRAVGENTFGHVVGETRVFTTLGNGSNPGGNGGNGTCSLPSVTTNSASVNGSSAFMTGTVQPTGNTGSFTWFFQYGTNGSLNQTSPSQSVSSGSGQVTANFTLSNIPSNTTYSYRLVVQNSCGNQQFGSTQTFSTGFNGNGGNNGGGTTGTGAPIVSTQTITTRTTNSATLSALVNPNNSETTAWFEYGTNASALTSLPARSMGNGFGQAPRNTLILSLRSGTTYFYRIAAQNAFGTTRGSILSFTTDGVAPTPVTPTTPAATSTPNPTPTTNPTSTVNPNPTPTTPTGAPVIIAKPEFSKDTVSAGDTVTYTLELKNNGSAAANNVSVTITLPNELEYSKSDPKLSSRNGASYVFTLGTMNAGDTKTLKVTLKAADTVTGDLTVQVNAVVDYTDASNKRQIVNGSRTVGLTAKGTSAFASIGDAFGRIGNIPGYIWFFIFLLLIILVVTWVFFKKLRGAEVAHDDHDAHDAHGEDGAFAHH